MEPHPRHGRRVLLSTVSSDSHTWNLVFLQLLLAESGHEVVNLGPCVPDRVLLAAARHHQPDAIVISTVNGHGHLDGARVARALKADPRTRHIPAIIGGKLGITGAGERALGERLLAAGFDAVLTDPADALTLPTRIAQLAPAGTWAAQEPHESQARQSPVPVGAEGAA